MAHTLTYSDYSYSSHDESQTEGEGDTLQWRQRQGRFRVFVDFELTLHCLL